MEQEVLIMDDFGEVLKRYFIPEGKNQFEGVSWEGVDLFGAQLGGANFNDAILYWAILASAHLDGANFSNANLQGANLTDASCVGANFRGANLGRDNLGGSSKLQGANLRAAIMEGAHLESEEFDERTIFPKGFAPSSYGMIVSASAIPSCRSEAIRASPVVEMRHRTGRQNGRLFGRPNGWLRWQDRGFRRAVGPAHAERGGTGADRGGEPGSRSEGDRCRSSA